jgi:hypothetical protein
MGLKFYSINRIVIIMADSKSKIPKVIRTTNNKFKPRLEVPRLYTLALVSLNSFSLVEFCVGFLGAQSNFKTSHTRVEIRFNVQAASLTKGAILHLVCSFGRLHHVQNFSRRSPSGNVLGSTFIYLLLIEPERQGTPWYNFINPVTSSN